MSGHDVQIVEQDTVVIEVLQEGVFVQLGVVQVELELAVPGIQGPPGPAGPAGPPGLDVYLEVVFSAPALVWEVTHGLPRRPAVTCLDTSGREVWGDESHAAGTVRVEWAHPMAGVLLLT